VSLLPLLQDRNLSTDSPRSMPTVHYTELLFYLVRELTRWRDVYIDVQIILLKLQFYTPQIDLTKSLHRYDQVTQRPNIMATLHGILKGNNDFTRTIHQEFFRHFSTPYPRSWFPAHDMCGHVPTMQFAYYPYSRYCQNTNQ